ncbi:unnamed protein product [Trifolium pratense]|uniref:Uncharacterized protein n=1 Tax=Trifolium pratense TaxID=57577 RepID=A0ACB0M5L3_TRIPR|nr:unnamed protein product [Trifolium pratense]
MKQEIPHAHIVELLVLGGSLKDQYTAMLCSISFDVCNGSAVIWKPKSHGTVSGGM